ncbi:MAG: malonyl-ACP O-methyltransferase BioC [Gammaproteobacteria bacterium]
MIEQRRQQRIATLNRIAHHYDQHAKWQQEIAQRLVEHLEPMRIAPKLILDLGARTGYSTRLLHKRYPKATIVAVDCAEKMLQQARKYSSWWWRPSLLCATEEHLPFASHRFDLIFANLVLAESQNSEQILCEIRRALRPEGLFLFSTLGPFTLHELRHSWAQADDKHVHVHDFVDMHDWGDHLVHAGLLDPVMDMEQLTVLYDDIDTLFRDLRGTGCQNQSVMRFQYLTGKQRLQKFLQAYEPFRQADGVWPVTLEVVYGHAWGPEAITTVRLDEKGEARIPLHAIKMLRR